MKTILITGSKGQLGREITCLYKDRNDISLVLTDIDNLDITDIKQVMKIMEEVKPYAVINCAAHTAVDACETDEINAFRINAVGPKNLAIAADKYGSKLVHISTDYVFDGHKNTPYTEFDIPCPKTVYGKSKLAGENFVKEFCHRYFIIRTAWLYGDGKNFVRTMMRLSETKDEIGVVADQYGSPTSAAVLVQIIDRLIDTESYGVYHGTCSGICTWADFAEEIFRLAGRKTVVKRITTNEYNAVAPRPAYSVLDNYMLRLTTDYQAPDWHEPLKDYIASKWRIL